MKNKRVQKWLMFMLMGLMALPLVGRLSLVQAASHADIAEQELNQDQKDVDNHDDGDIDDKDDKEVEENDKDDKEMHENNIDDKDLKGHDVGQKDASEKGQHND